MNYIRHLNAVFGRLSTDERLHATHVALYYTLLQFWNQARFRDKFFIVRSEMMQSSKIGSANTYLKCLRQLDEWGYIRYFPSHNPARGSQVSLYSFDISDEQAAGQHLCKNGTSSNTTTATTNDASAVQPVRPFTNGINTRNNTVQTNETTKRDDKPDEKQSVLEKEKMVGKAKKEVPRRGKQSKPDLLFSETVFADKQAFKTAFADSAYQNANLDYYHEVIKNWSDGKQARKKDWIATAKNWMLNDFKDGKLIAHDTHQSGYASQTNGSDYRELGNAVDQWFERKYGK